MPWPVYHPDPVEELTDRIIEDLRGLVRTDKRNYADLAGDAKLAASTIAKLASGETRRPQFRTILRLASVLPGGQKLLGQRLIDSATGTSAMRVVA